MELSGQQEGQNKSRNRAGRTGSRRQGPQKGSRGEQVAARCGHHHGICTPESSLGPVCLGQSNSTHPFWVSKRPALSRGLEDIEVYRVCPRGADPIKSREKRKKKPK